ncbi:hypothetical protein [Clostridium grantii]|uniref:Uncharacterized protein n=1 Tax=Clostridium grantii DSM 8605 TaxID=1121316 RepID=A0A1M5X7P6_9CLOT|nr:hypothetical protein [Clostridium grantii]SHH95243.1 hypothetical protein SAMN02745207_03375 [Clostridium grantii DSM 8605]
MKKKVWCKPEILVLMAKDTQHGGQRYDHPDGPWTGENKDTRSFS